MTKKGGSFMKHSQIECCYRCEKGMNDAILLVKYMLSRKKIMKNIWTISKKKVYIINICSILKNATFRENNTLLYERMVLFNEQQYTETGNLIRIRWSRYTVLCYILLLRVRRGHIDLDDPASCRTYAGI